MPKIIHLLSSKIWDDRERFVADLCCRDRDEGLDVGVITRKFPAVAQRYENENLLLGTIAMRGFLGTIFAPVSIATYLNKLEDGATIFIHDLRDTALVLNAKRLAGNGADIKVVAMIGDVLPVKNDTPYIELYTRLDGIVFLSQTACDNFLSKVPSFDTSKISVSTPDFSEIPHNDKRKTDDSPARLIFSGHITAEKGLGLLIDALATIKDLEWRLTVCGSGSGRVVMPLVRRARSLDINNRIDWKGADCDIALETDIADIAVFPSAAQSGSAYAAVDALKRGCIVVAPNSGAFAETLADHPEAELFTISDSKPSGISNGGHCSTETDALAAALRCRIASLV